jgi:hypothetical protein
MANRCFKRKAFAYERETQSLKNIPRFKAADLRTGEVGMIANEFLKKRSFQEATGEINHEGSQILLVCFSKHKENGGRTVQGNFCLSSAGSVSVFRYFGAIVDNR